MYSASARAVEFAKENALPLTQNEVALLYEHRNIGSHETGLDMAIAIAFAVTKPRLALWDRTLQIQQDIVNDIGIGVLIDCHCSRRVRTIHYTTPVGDS